MFFIILGLFSIKNLYENIILFCLQITNGIHSSEQKEKLQISTEWVLIPIHSANGS